jgi:hypothetical protein
MSTAGAAERRSVSWSVLLAFALLAIVGAAWWLMLDAGRDSGAAGAGGEVILAQADADDADEGDVIDLASIEVTYDYFLARDPFESIRPPEPVSTDPGSSNGDPGNGDPGNDDGVCRTGTEAVCNGTVVVLRGVADGSASIEVNGVTYEVEPGGVFASSFQLIRIEGSCVDILYLEGDEAEVFRLCDGDTVAK